MRAGSKSDGRAVAISCRKRWIGSPPLRGPAVRPAGCGPTCPTCRRSSSAPKGLRLATDRRKWAEERLTELEATRLAGLQAALDRGGQLDARFEGGELRLFVDGSAVLERIYLDDHPGRLAEAYWRWLLLSAPPRDAERFAADLRRPPAASDAPAAAQFVERVAALATEVAAIEAEEAAMNEFSMDFTASHPTSGILWRTRAGAGAGRRQAGDGVPDPLECLP